MPLQNLQNQAKGSSKKFRYYCNPRIKIGKIVEIVKGRFLGKIGKVAKIKPRSRKVFVRVKNMDYPTAIKNIRVLEGRFIGIHNFIIFLSLYFTIHFRVGWFVLSTHISTTATSGWPTCIRTNFEKEVQWERCSFRAFLPILRQNAHQQNTSRECSYEREEEEDAKIIMSIQYWLEWTENNTNIGLVLLLYSLFKYFMPIEY